MAVKSLDIDGKKIDTIETTAFDIVHEIFSLLPKAITESEADCAEFCHDPRTSFMFGRVELKQQ